MQNKPTHRKKKREKQKDTDAAIFLLHQAARVAPLVNRAR
jgi:hypothetical protein